MTRSAAKAASFWQPSRPHTCVSPAADDRWAWTIATSGLSGGHGVDHAVAVGRRYRPDQRVGGGHVGLEVRAEREERQVHRSGGVPADHPEVAVLLDLERLVGQLALDAAPDGAEAADARVAEPAEHELGGHAAGDHLVVDDVGGEAGQGQVALALADDLVPGREADEVGEALDRDGVAVADQVGNRVAHRRDLGGHPAASTSCIAPASTASWRTPSSWPATWATASVKIRRADVHLRLADRQRRRHPDARDAALQDQQAALEARPLDLLGVLGGVELDAQHQALAADVADEAVEAADQRPEPGERLLATRGGVVDQAAFEQVDRHEAGGAGDRVAAVGRAVRAGTPRLHEVGPRDHRGQRHAAGDALGGQHDVGLDAPVLDRPHLPGPTRARLDLVGDEQDAVAVAQLAETLEEAVLGDDVAALALDRLDDDGRHLLGRRELVEQHLVEPAQVLDPPERRVEHARQQRAEAGVVLRLRGGQRDGAVRAPMERAEERHDVRPLRGEAGELDRGFDRFGAGIARGRRGRVRRSARSRRAAGRPRDRWAGRSRPRRSG